MVPNAREPLKRGRPSETPGFEPRTVSVNLKVRSAAANATSRKTIIVVRNVIPIPVETLTLGGSRPGGRNLRNKTMSNLSGCASARDTVVKFNIARMGKKYCFQATNKMVPHMCREALCHGLPLPKAKLGRVAIA